MGKWHIKIIKNTLSDLFHIIPKLMSAKIIICIVNSGLSVITALLLVRLLELALNMSDYNFLNKDILVITGFYVVSYFVLQINDVILYYIDNIWIVPKMEYFHHKLSEHLTAMSLESADLPDIQNKFWRAKDALYQDRLIEVFMSVFNIIPIMIQMFGTLILLGSYSMWLVTIAFFSVFPSAAVLFWSGKKEYAFSVEQTSNIRMEGYLWDVLTKQSTVKEAKVYGFGSYIKNKYYILNRNNYKEKKKVFIKVDSCRLIAEIFRCGLYIIAIAFSVDLVRNGFISAGMFGGCIMIFASMQEKAVSFFSYFTLVGNACRYAADYYNFFDIELDSDGGEFFNSDISSVDFENVCYKYKNSGKNSIENISFSIKNGELVVIVGENGAGKSTLSKLILGLYKPCSGTISVNGKLLNDFSQENYLSSISVAIQDFERYAISFNDNITISDFCSMNICGLENLIENFNLKKVVKRLGDSEAILGIEFGDNDLSGGEWQRVALARALYKKSSLIILDEPTSAIDPIHEYYLLKQFLKISQNQTGFIISHRVGICKYADKILVMNKGKLVEVGKHEELLKNKGKYFELWEAQASSYR